jgi:N-acetylmuramic acid 6-phosphate etherase
MLFAGIDGGATRTRVALASETGRVLGSGLAGPSNVDNVSLEEARAAIGDALAQALGEAGLPGARIDAAFFGMAGVVSEADCRVIRTLAGAFRSLDQCTISVDHDIRIALAGSLPEDVGIVLIVGTGSSCYGRRADGRHHQTGWGYLLDDRGSSFALGLEAMKAAVREYDGRGEPTALTPRVMEHLGISSMPEILHALYHRRRSIPEIGAFAPTVLELAEAGDPVAFRVQRNGAAELSLMVVAVARHLELLGQSVPLAMVGGLVEASPFYRKEITGAVRERLGHVAFVDAALPPVLGAVRLALESKGITFTETIRESLVASRTRIRA